MADSPTEATPRATSKAASKAASKVGAKASSTAAPANDPPTDRAAIIQAQVMTARRAADEFRKLDQVQVDAIVAAMVRAGLTHAVELAALAVKESGFGVFEDKVVKNFLATEFLNDYLRDKDPRIRSAAAEGLGRLRNPSDSATVDAVYKDEDKTSPRLSQAFALVMESQAQLSEFSPLQYLINTLNSASYAGEAFPLLVEAARFAAIRSLLYRPLETGTRDEKIYLARVLAASGDEQALPYLQKVSQDPDAQVAAEGLKALRELRARLG